MEQRKQQSGRKVEDAIALLMADHKQVQKLFKDFQKLNEGDETEKAAIVNEACTALTIHSQLEEEIFYPAAREILEEDDLLDEAEVEHATAKELIAQLESMEPGEPLYEAKFTVLAEYVNHHIKEEQDEMFPAVKRAKLDVHALGERMTQRKHELEAEMGVIAPGDEEEELEQEPRRKRVSR